MYFLFEFQKPEKRVAKGGGGGGSVLILFHTRILEKFICHLYIKQYFMCYKFKSVHFKSHVTPPCLSVRFMLHALFSDLIKHHVQTLFYPLKTISCFGATLPLPSAPPPLPHPSSFSDSSSKACRDMKPLVFKRDNDSKVTLIVDSHLEHGPIFNVNITSSFMHKMTCDY